MFNLPFFNYQYNYPYYKYYHRYNNNYNQNANYYNSTNITPHNTTSTNYNSNPTTNQAYIPIQKQETKNSITNSKEISNTINSRSSSKSNTEQAIFEILGIKLFLDDLIILGLLFFLYQEDVKDEMLYIILFLLLFS